MDMLKKLQWVIRGEKDDSIQKISVGHLRNTVRQMLSMQQDITDLKGIIELNKETMDNLIEANDMRQQEIERLKGEGWISVDDRLPEVDGYYLFICKKNLPFIGFYSNKYVSVNMDERYSCLHELDHWQPLPKAPEVG